MFTRALPLPAPGRETFFLWGPRLTGRTTLLQQAYPGAVWVDLLKADEYRRYLERPERLREELGDRLMIIKITSLRTSAGQGAPVGAICG